MHVIRRPKLRPSLLWVVIALVLGGCLRVPPREGRLRELGRSSEAQLGVPIRVLVWNVYKSSRPTWAGDFARLTRSHDLVLLQEGLWNAELRPLYEATNMRWALGVAWESGSGPNTSHTGTVLGSRAMMGPVIVGHSYYREPIVDTPKSHIAASFRIANADESVLAISVHAINFRLESWPFEHHVDQVVALVEAHDGPVILAGDFNTWSEARTDYLFARTQSQGLQAVYARGPAAEEGDGRMTWADNYLDHAFVRGLRVVGAPRILRELASSDHSALSFAVAPPLAPRSGDSFRRLDP